MKTTLLKHKSFLCLPCFSVLAAKYNNKRKTVNICSVYLFPFKKQSDLETSGIIYTGEARMTTFPLQQPKKRLSGFSNYHSKFSQMCFQ